MNATSVVHSWISFPPGSDRLPVNFVQQDFLFILFELLIHWIAYFIACASVTISLLVCMTIILFSCACVLEMLIQFATDVLCIVKRQ